MSKLAGVPTMEFKSILKANGYKLDRCSGGHEIWERTVTDSISVPIHKKEVRGCIARRLIKEHNLEVEE